MLSFDNSHRQLADVDVVWFKNPLDYFQDKNSVIADFDVYFQGKGISSSTFRMMPLSNI